MALDLTPVTIAELRIDRLELADNATVEFLQNDGTGEVVLKTLTQADNWSMTGIENLYINVDFVRFLVLEFTSFEDLLAKTTAIRFEGIRFKLERTHRPIGVNRVWSFKLEPLDDWK
jgi:hypothetical protein